MSHRKTVMGNKTESLLIDLVEETLSIDRFSGGDTLF